MKRIVPYRLNDGVRPILEQAKPVMGPSEAVLLQM